MRSIKLAFLVVTAHFKRRLKFVIFLLGGLAVLIFLLLKFNLLFVKASISEGITGTYQTHDLPLEVTGLISQGLVEFDKNGRAVAKLAASWETNHDSTEFKFKLKDNLRWIDGTAIKSSDLEFGIPDVEVSYPDPKTIVFKLKEPYAPFPTLLSKPVVKKGTLTGIGPYQITKIEKSRIFITKLTLKSKDPALPKVYVRFYPNENTALTGFKLGEVQALLGVTNPNLISDNPQLKAISKTDFGRVVAIFYQTKDNLVGNRSIRQALSFSVPKVEGYTEALSPIPPFSWAYIDEPKKYLSNMEAATLALVRAKASVSEDSLKKELVLTATPQLETVGQKVVSSWKELGLEAKLRVESGIPQNFQALLITQNIPVDPDQYFLWHSTQDKTNLTKYSSSCCPLSARVDKDLEDGRKTFVEDDRKVKYRDFQKDLLEDAPATFLYFPKFNIIYLKKVEDSLNKLLNLQLSNLTKSPA